MVNKTQYADVPAYVTRDGSLVRELMHPRAHANRAQSLAEATVAPPAPPPACIATIAPRSCITSRPAQA